MPAGASNPFSPVSQQAAFGIFKATGSRDRDVAFAQKETMLAPYNNLRKLAILSFVIGGLFTIMVIMAWFGIPVLIGAWLLRRFQAKQAANVEAAHSQYLATIGAAAVGAGGL
jgi:hypothetical protein